MVRIKENSLKNRYKKMSNAKRGLYLGGKNPAAKAVICIETGEIFSTVKEAAASKNICRETIRNFLSGRSKGGGGYHWKYANKIGA